MCCQAEWKREAVPDHKFDFINVREFHSDSIGTRLKYILKYILILKSFAIYGLDVFTATTMILSDHWTNAIQRKCGDNCAIDVQFKVAKWVFVGCIIFSFLLLGYETYKAKRVIESRDISYAFTNLIANDYYSVKSYDIFCLFCRIYSSTKKTDDFAFFIYFTFKDWKRLLLADGPRQSINALTLYSFAYANGFNWSDLPSWWDESVSTAMLLFAICFTVIIFLGSLILLIAASILYVPLLCYIQGNLKEYVCHKVDKRIAELIHKNRRDRIRRNAALEKKMANGSIKDAPGIIPQPTLPSISLDDEDVGRKRQRKMDAERSRGGARQAKKEYAEYEVYNSAGLGYPPTLDYAQPTQVYEYEQYGSSANLAASAAPMGLGYPQVQAPRRAASPQQTYLTSTSNSNLFAASQPAFPPRGQQEYAYRSQSPSQYLQPSHNREYEYDYQRAVPPALLMPSQYDGLAYDRQEGYTAPTHGPAGQAYGLGGWEYRR